MIISKPELLCINETSSICVVETTHRFVIKELTQNKLK